MTELYKKYRPKSFKQVVGQDTAVKILSKAVKAGDVPKSILFSGPSGCGKTTLGRILATKLECDLLTDFNEINAADERGIDLSRYLNKHSNYRANGTCKVFLIDECHQLTAPAQSALLKTLEDTPPENYFFLATTDPHKLKDAVRGRCLQLNLRPVGVLEITQLLKDVAEKEGIETVSEKIMEEIAESVSGSAREALVLLEAVAKLESEKEQRQHMAKVDAKTPGIAIARLLMDSRTKWKDMKPHLKDLEHEPEVVRRIILGYATSAILGNGDNKYSEKTEARAGMLLSAFEGHFFDSGKAGLVHACRQVLFSGD